MSKLYNLARVETTTTGSGTMTLGDAVTGCLTFANAGVQNGEVVSYTILDSNNTESGHGTYASAGPTLARTTIYSSTNSGSAINLSGNAQVAITVLAEDFQFVDLGAAITTNETYNGMIFQGVVDTNSIGFSGVLSQGADFHWDEASASSIDYSVGVAMACESGSGLKVLLLQGQICNTSWDWSAGLIYLSTTAGSLTQTAGSATDNVILPVALALSADTIYFNPGFVTLETV